MERYYKLNEVYKALKQVHPEETRMSKMTMIRYLNNGIGDYELEDNKHGSKMYLITKETLLEMANEYNRTRTIDRVDVESVIALLDGEGTPEVRIKQLEEEVIRLNEELKEKEILKAEIKIKDELIEKKEERIETLKTQVLEFEEQQRTLLKEKNEREDKMKNYLIALEIYNSTNPIVRIFKKIKRPKFEG